MLKLNKGLKDKISYGIIGAIIFTALLPIFGSHGGLILLFQYVFILSLAVFYAVVSERIDLFFLTFLLLALQMLSLIGFNTNTSDAVYNLSFRIYSVVSIVSWGVAALALWVEARHHRESRSIELAEIFLIIILLIPLCITLLKSVSVNTPDIPSGLLYLGIAVLIGILMYNKKIRVYYTENKKHLFIFFLTVISVEVIKICTILVLFNL